jgi:hypothetical protein
MCGLVDERTDSTGVLALRGAWGEKSLSVLCGSTSVGLQPGTLQAVTTTLSRCYLLIFFPVVDMAFRSARVVWMSD